MMLFLVVSHRYEGYKPLTEKSAPASRASVCRRDGVSLDRPGSILTAKV